MRRFLSAREFHQLSASMVVSGALIDVEPKNYYYYYYYCYFYYYYYYY